MTDRIEAKVYGFDELAEGGRRLGVRIEEEAAQRFGATAEAMAARTGARVPRRSGRLAASLFAGSEDSGATVGIGEGVPYAGWIEFGGTRGRPYFPTGRYLYPTALTAEPALVLAALQAADKEIEVMRWPSPSQAT